MYKYDFVPLLQWFPTSVMRCIGCRGLVIRVPQMSGNLRTPFQKRVHPSIDTSEQGCRKAYKGDVIYERSVPVTRDPIHESKV